MKTETKPMKMLAWFAWAICLLVLATSCATTDGSASSASTSPSSEFQKGGERLMQH